MPSGEESTDEKFCPHGCSLFIERRDSGLEAFCLEHPEEGSIRITENYLSRYKLSIENLLKRIHKVNELEGEIAPCGRGYFFGYKTHGDKTIALVLVPSITKEDLLGIAGLGVLLKDYHYIFVIAPTLYVKWLWAIPSLGDRIVLLNLDEVLNDKTFELSFDWGVFKLRQRGVLKDLHLEITGNIHIHDGHEVRINSNIVHLSDAPFLLLLRFVQGAMTQKDRWVSVKELIDENILTQDGLYQGINRLKKELKHCVDWDRFLENGEKQYRLSLNVTGLTVNRKKLLESGNGRIKAIAQEIPSKVKAFVV